MIPGAEMRARLDDRLGVAAVTYLLFGVKLGPATGAVPWSWSSPSGSVGDGCAGKRPAAWSAPSLPGCDFFAVSARAPADVILKLATEGLTVCAYVPGVYELGRSRIELGRRRVERALL